MSMETRKLFKGEEDVIKLYPLKYTWPMDYYDQGNANFWLPKEVPMGADLQDWRKLTPNEKGVIETSLGFFTTADSLVANNLVLHVYRHITAPEARMYLLKQAYDEAVHSESYQHVVASLGLDEERIFNMYRDIEAIYNKDGFVTETVEPLKSTSVTLQEFCEALFRFYVCMEGLFFYSSFAAIFSFGRRNLLSGTVEQFQYILRDESMHLNFGLELLKGLRAEAEEPLDFGAFYPIITKAVALEQKYASDMLGKGVLGLTIEAYHRYIEFVADRRLESLSLTPVYSTKNPFPWMSEIIDMRKDKKVFESRVIDYQQGGLKW